MDLLSLRDAGITRTDLLAIRSGTFQRAPASSTERIVFNPESALKGVAPRIRQQRRDIASRLGAWVQRIAREHAMDQYKPRQMAPAWIAACSTLPGHRGRGSQVIERRRRLPGE